MWWLPDLDHEICKFGSYGADNISYVSSILEWLRKRVLATGLDEGRWDSALDFHGLR